jgi:hypothetical protein
MVQVKHMRRFQREVTSIRLQNVVMQRNEFGPSQIPIPVRNTVRNAKGGHEVWMKCTVRGITQVAITLKEQW